MVIRRKFVIAALGLGFCAALLAYFSFRASELISFKGHVWPIEDIVSNADGHVLASVSWKERLIRVWDVSSCENVAKFPTRGEEVSLALSSDGRKLAAWSAKTIRWWDISSGTEGIPLDGHTDVVTSVVFCSSPLSLASVSRDSTVKIWNLRTGKERLTLNGHTAWIRSIAINRQETILASACSPTIILWDFATGKKVASIPTITKYDYVRCLQLSPDGKLLAYATLSNPIPVLLDTRSYSELPIDTPRNIDFADEPTISSLAFSPDSQVLVACIDGTVVLWNAASGRTIQRQTLRDSLSEVSDRLIGINHRPSFLREEIAPSLAVFSPEGKLTVVGVHGTMILAKQIGLLE